MFGIPVETTAVRPAISAVFQVNPVLVLTFFENIFDRHPAHFLAVIIINENAALARELEVNILTEKINPLAPDLDA